MKNIIAILAAAALMAACAKKIDPDDVRAAMPQASVIQIATPTDGDPGALTVAPAVGTVSEYAVASWWTAATFNVSTFWVLAVIQTITLFPPTDCSTDQCTWGPWTDNETQAVWKLDVSTNGDGYDYTLAAHPADSSTFLSIVSGTAFKGSRVGRGNGDFTVSFDNGAIVDPTSDDQGVLAVSYDNRTSLHLGATFLGAKNDDPANPESTTLDIAYQFGASATGGELQVMFETMDGVAKNLSLRTRWTHGGPGRGDASYTEGSTNFKESQCWTGTGVTPWDTSYEEVLVNGTPLDPAGELATCGVFSTPLYSDLVLP